MGWLGATFLNEVPSQRYPKLDKKRDIAATQVTTEKNLVALSDSGLR